MFTFNDVSAASMGITVSDYTTSAGPAVERTLLTVPGRAGAYLQSVRRGVRTISFTCSLSTTGTAGALADARALASWLLTDEIGELYFDDEPTKVYYAILAGGEVALERAFSMRKFTLAFVCPDPYAYAADEDAYDVQMDAFTVTNGGGENVFPRFTLPIEGDETYVRIEHPDGRFVQIGTPPGADQSTEDVEARVLYEDCSSLTGWSTGIHTMKSKTRNGAVAGTMLANGDFYATDFGAGTSVWHGPSQRKSLSAAVDDFAAEVGFNFDNVASPYAAISNESVTLTGTNAATLAHQSVNATKVTRIKVTNSAGTKVYSGTTDYEVYFSSGTSYIRRRTGTTITSGATVKVDYAYVVGKCGGQCVVLSDVNGVEVARLGMLDISDTAADARVFAKIGTTVVADTPKAPLRKSRVFDGMGRGRYVIVRRDGRWTFRVLIRATDGSYFTIWETSPTTTDATLIGMVDVNVSRYSNRSGVPTNRIEGLTVRSLVAGTPDVIPLIAKAGDLLAIDCDTHRVTRNGQAAMSNVDVRSTFFDLAPGDTSLTLRTGNGASVTTWDFGGHAGIVDTEVPDFDPATQAVAHVRKRWL